VELSDDSAVLDCRDDVFPVEPDLQTQFDQTLGQASDSRLVDTAVRQKNVPFKGVTHETGSAC
jgi:hypothetical protein